MKRDVPTKEKIMSIALSTVVTAQPEDVISETQYANLNRRKFVRGASAQHQWFLLVNDALLASKLPFNETVRDYLAVMLNRFMDRPQLQEELDTFDYYQYFFGKKTVDSTSVQDVADMSLQFVALFPERSKYRHQPRSVEYVTEMGIGLYQDLARDTRGKDDWWSGAYPVMAKSFGYAVLLLRSMYAGFIVKNTSQDAGRPVGNWYIPTDVEARDLRKTSEQFGLMHFETPGLLTSTKLN